MKEFGDKVDLTPHDFRRSVINAVVPSERGIVRRKKMLIKI